MNADRLDYSSRLPQGWELQASTGLGAPGFHRAGRRKNMCYRRGLDWLGVLYIAQCGSTMERTSFKARVIRNTGSVSRKKRLEWMGSHAVEVTPSEIQAFQRHQVYI